jgi:hypothetical protein
MFETLLATPVASAAGLAAAGLLIACPMMTSRQGMLIAQIGVGCLFACHFLLLGVHAAGAVNVLGATQAAAALFATRHAWLGRIGYALIPQMIAAGLWFWSGPVSALAVGAMTVIALARMQEDEADIRHMLLGGTLLWTAHDAIVGAWIPLGADIVTGLISILALSAMRRRQSVGPALA